MAAISMIRKLTHGRQGTNNFENHGAHEHKENQRSPNR